MSKQSPQLPVRHMERLPQRPVRPVERQPMRDWIEELLDSDVVPGLKWLDKGKGEFRIKWCHGSRHGWSLKDADLFERWAKHTGRYNTINDPKRWKANFRCALNSLKDVEEVTDKSQSKGTNAFRVYRIKKKTDSVKRHRMVRRQGNKEKDIPNKRPNTRLQKYEDISEEEQFIKEESKYAVQARDADDEASTDESLPQMVPSTVEEHKVKCESTDSNLPKFEKILPGLERVVFGKMHYLPRHQSGFTVHICTPTQQLPPLSGLYLSDSVPTTLPTTIPTMPQTTCYQGTTDTTCQGSGHHVNLQHVTFPETPEGSDASSPRSDLTDEEFIEVSLIEVSQEVTVESESTMEADYTIIDISSPTTVAPSTGFHSQSSPLPSLSTMMEMTSQMSYFGQTSAWPPGFVPLTPPGQI